MDFMISKLGSTEAICYRVGSRMWKLRLYLGGNLVPFITTIESEKYPAKKVLDFLNFVKTSKAIINEINISKISLIYPIR